MNGQQQSIRNEECLSWNTVKHYNGFSLFHAFFIARIAFHVFCCQIVACLMPDKSRKCFKHEYTKHLQPRVPIKFTLFIWARWSYKELPDAIGGSAQWSGKSLAYVNNLIKFQRQLWQNSAGKSSTWVSPNR